MSLLASADIALIRAANPGPLTLAGTNSYLVGRDPAWLIDPGPALHAHLRALTEEATARGGIAGILITHSHHDHCEALDFARRLGDEPIVVPSADPASPPLRAARSVGPFTLLPTPGHAPDHIAILHGRTCFTGDTVLGEGSVFIAPEAGALNDYMQSLERLQALDIELICPGHGPPIGDPHGKLAEYIAHRREREQMLLVALDAGLRSAEQLLSAAWSEVPPVLRPVAALSLKAHLFKLQEEGRLPADLPSPDLILPT